MDSETTATGRPRQRAPLLTRLALFIVLVVVSFEATLRARELDGVGGTGAVTWLEKYMGTFLRPYVSTKSWALHHPLVASACVVAAVAAIVLAYRALLLFWHNQFAARLSGTRIETESLSFPSKTFDLLREVGRRPKGSTFVGMSPKRGLLFGWRWRPAYLTAEQRALHRHVIGRTGSGKTASVLWPAILQDVLDGKGVLVMDAKGSDENIHVMKAIAAVAGRQEQLKVFALPAWNQPELFSHTYNPVWVLPRTREQRGGDPVAMAQRVFKVLPLGEDIYYQTQAQTVFINLCRVLHGMVDATGNGLPFNLKDISVCLKGMGDSGPWGDALNHCVDRSLDREAAREISSQLQRLGKEAPKTFSGIIAAVDTFQSPLVNAYAPDIVFDEVLETNALVYVQLPANLFKVAAPALGKLMLMDVEQAGSLRQVFRGSRNQTPFSVTVDEFYNFADLSMIDSLNKLRDANLHYTLAHQSIADLELVSKEFAQAVWDNTATRDVLAQNNHELCERLAKSIGTEQVVEKTVRQQQGAFFTSLTTGDASTRRVEQFKLHPNAIKALTSCGQGYLFNDAGIRPVSYAMLPRTMKAHFALPKNDPTTDRGLRLYDCFVERKSSPWHRLGELRLDNSGES